MKLRLIFLFSLFAILVACDKDEEDAAAPSSSATIGGEMFDPDDNSVRVSAANLLLVFTNGAQTVTIVTNDVAAGTYEIVPDPVKSGALQANLTYTNGEETYTGSSGTVSIGISGNLYSGSYNAFLTGENNTTLEISSGTFSDIAGTEETLLLSEAQINQALEEMQTLFADFVRYSFLFDAVYANQEEAPDNSWLEVYEHTVDASDLKVTKLWEDGFEIIHKTNLIIASGEAIFSENDDAYALVSPATAVRGYVNLVLMNWFGGIPVLDEPESELYPRNDVLDVFEWIKYNAELSLAFLPDDNYSEAEITKSFARELLARVTLYWEDFNYTYVSTEEIIESGIYSLDSEPANFQPGSPEIIFGFEKGNNAEFNAFFDKGTVVPVLRFTETLLISAITNFTMGSHDAALETVNTVRARRGETALSTLTIDHLYEKVITELYHEGEIFTMMKYLDKVDEAFALEYHRYLLPVPTAAMTENPKLEQNPGY